MDHWGHVKGGKSGEAFAELPGREAERAVRALDRRSLGSRYIEVFVSSASEAGSGGWIEPGLRASAS